MKLARYHQFGWIDLVLGEDQMRIGSQIFGWERSMRRALSSWIRSHSENFAKITVNLSDFVHWQCVYEPPREERVVKRVVFTDWDYRIEREQVERENTSCSAGFRLELKTHGDSHGVESHGVLFGDSSAGLRKSSQTILNNHHPRAQSASTTLAAHRRREVTYFERRQLLTAHSTMLCSWMERRVCQNWSEQWSARSAVCVCQAIKWLEIEGEMRIGRLLECSSAPKLSCWWHAKRAAEREVPNLGTLSLEQVKSGRQLSAVCLLSRSKGEW